MAHLLAIWRHLPQAMCDLELCLLAYQVLHVARGLGAIRVITYFGSLPDLDEFRTLRSHPTPRPPNRLR